MRSRKKSIMQIGGELVDPSVYKKVHEKYGQDMYNKTLNELAQEYGQSAFPRSWGHLSMERDEDSTSDLGLVQLREITEGPAYRDNTTIDKVKDNFMFMGGSTLTEDDWINLYSFMQIVQKDYSKYAKSVLHKKVPKKPLTYKQLMAMGLPPACGSKNFTEFVKNNHWSGLYWHKMDELNKTYGAENVALNELLLTASGYGLNTNRDLDEIVQELSILMPCEWIYSIFDYKVPELYRKLYVSDLMLVILHNVIEGKVTPTDIVLINEVNEELYLSPRTNMQFIAFRGMYDNPGWKIGDVLVFNTPKSASLSPSIALQSNYMGPNEYEGSHCCFTEIIIPPNMVLSYHHSENQVIFPTGAEFEVLGKRHAKYAATDWFPIKKQVMIYTIRYTSAPEKPFLYKLTDKIPVVSKFQGKK